MDESEALERAIRISITPDGTRAVIDVLPFTDSFGHRFTKDDLKFYLELNDVKNGILWDSLEKALAVAEESGKAVYNIPAAECASGNAVIVIPGLNKTLSSSQFQLWQNKTRESSAAILGNSVLSEGSSFLFVKTEEMVLTWTTKGNSLNVRGEPFTNVTMQATPRAGKNIIVTEHDSITTFTAAISGYLIVDSRNNIDIMSPLFTEKVEGQMMYMNYLIVPSPSKKEIVKDAVDSTIKSIQADSVSKICIRPDEQNLMKLFDDNQSHYLRIRNGIAPQKSKNAVLEIKINRKVKKEIPDSIKVEHRDDSPFVEISEETLIAVKIKRKKGIDGIDIYGKMILTGKNAKDADFKIGNNIRKEEVDDRINYYADKTGIFSYSDTTINVDEELHVIGSVDILTGNVRYSRNVIIDGNISSGFTVDCGGILTVKGNIEKGATVKSVEGLNVLSGIFGEETKVTVSAGDAQLGFIQNSSIHVNGNVTINDFSYLSHVFCKGNLKILGRKNIGSNSCVVGGRLNSLGSMDLFSAGSSVSKTELFCGFNAEVVEKLTEIRAMLPSLTRKVVQLQERLGIDLKQGGILEELQRLSPKRKEELKKQLLVLKEITTQRETLTNTAEKLEKLSFAPETSSLEIVIHKQLIPSIYVRIGKAGQVFTERMGKVAFKVNEESLMVSNLA